MEEFKIASFQKDHDRLQPGFYFSTLQRGVATFDLRFKKPNAGDFLAQAALHSIEHMLATALRAGACGAHILYFGPMGCRTGFYLLLGGAPTCEQVFPLVRDMLTFIAEFEGDIPGASPRDCGNWSDMDLPAARERARRYRDDVFLAPDPARMRYPE